MEGRQRIARITAESQFRQVRIFADLNFTEIIRTKDQGSKTKIHKKILAGFNRGIIFLSRVLSLFVPFRGLKCYRHQNFDIQKIFFVRI